VSDEDLEAVHNLCERNCLVALPVADCLGTLGEDDIVLLVSLVVDLGLGSVSTSHFEGFCCFEEECVCQSVIGLYAV